MTEEQKLALEKEHSAKMNAEAVERIKQEAMLESQRTEAIFFEDDEEVKLRDGKTYKIAPASLKNARKLMNLFKTVNVDVIILNFVPTGDEEQDAKREDELFQVLEIAFAPYNLTREYMEEYVDVETARKIIEILIGINGIKKS